MTATTYTATATIPRPASLGSGQWQLDGLLPISILFGKNGSGKSLLLRAWRDSQLAHSHYVIPERTGSLGFNPNFLQQQMAPQQRREISGTNYVNEYRQHVIARVQAYFLARGATRLGQLPGNPADLEALIADLLPDFTVDLIGESPPYKLRRAASGQEVGGVEQLSSGEAQVLTLGLDILTIAAIWDIQKAPMRLLLVDEPDAHIHPDLQVRFADFLTRVADTYSLQVVVATHSTTLLSSLGQFAGARCGVIYVDRTKSTFKAAPFTAVLKELAACLGGHALMGPLFGVPLLLVEGDDDYRIWSQVPRHHVTSFAVIPCNGDEIYTYQESLEKIFGALRSDATEPAGFALLDGDKPLPAGKPQTHVRFIRLGCHEAENLFLSDEVLALINTDWAKAAAAIAATAQKHGNKAAALSTAPTWNRQSHDLKALIGEISAAVDPKPVHWTHRLGVTLGRAKPSGQLAAFLGPDVIAALWR